MRGELEGLLIFLPIEIKEKGGEGRGKKGEYFREEKSREEERKSGSKGREGRPNLNQKNHDSESPDLLELFL